MFQSRYSAATALDWSYGGVNSSIPGNGGPECASFLSLERRLAETLAACCLSLLYVWWGWQWIALPDTLSFVRKDRGGKRLLLVVVSMVFGVEIGFKFATKQLIYLLNPCHVTTALQIYLLAAPPSRYVTVLFRIHLNNLPGAVLALLFPVTNSRLLPFEEELYWVQHTLMLVTPYYLLRLGGVYTIEDLCDMSWTVLSTGLIFLYHYLPLQAIGMLAEVNLNNMLCPAISDPFYGPNYRLAATLHQSLCIPLVSKAFCCLATFFITTCPLTKIKDNLGTDVTMSAYIKDCDHSRYHGNNDAGRHHDSRCLGNASILHRRSLSDVNAAFQRRTTQQNCSQQQAVANGLAHTAGNGLSRSNGLTDPATGKGVLRRSSGVSAEPAENGVSATARTPLTGSEPNDDCTPREDAASGAQHCDADSPAHGGVAADSVCGEGLDCGEIYAAGSCCHESSCCVVVCANAKSVVTEQHPHAD